MSVVLNFYYFMFMLGLIIFWPTDFRKSAIFDNFFGFQGGTASVFSFKSPNLAYSLLFICIFWITGILAIIFTKSVIFGKIGDFRRFFLFFNLRTPNLAYSLLFICIFWIRHFGDYFYKIGNFLAKSAIFVIARRFLDYSWKNIKWGV